MICFVSYFFFVCVFCCFFWLLFLSFQLVRVSMPIVSIFILSVDDFPDWLLYGDRSDWHIDADSPFNSHLSRVIDFIFALDSYLHNLWIRCASSLPSSAPSPPFACFWYGSRAPSIDKCCVHFGKGIVRRVRLFARGYCGEINFQEEGNGGRWRGFYLPLSQPEFRCVSMWIYGLWNFIYIYLSVWSGITRIFWLKCC